MAVSRGKAFEAVVKRDLLQVPFVLVERLYDVMSGYKNQRSPADFIVYNNPFMTYLECKSIRGNSIPFNDIRQLDDLNDRLDLGIPGVRCWIIVWFIDKKKTYVIDARVAKYLRDNSGKKSISTQDCEKHAVEVPAMYKRVYATYDFSHILTKTQI